MRGAFGSHLGQIWAGVYEEKADTLHGIGDFIFPESFCWRVLARLCGVAFAHFGASCTSLRPRFLTEKTRTQNQNVRFAWCSDFKTCTKWTNKSETYLARFASLTEHRVLRCFPMTFLYRVLQCFWKNMFCEICKIYIEKSILASSRRVAFWTVLSAAR